MQLILSASAFVNAVPKLNSDHSPGMPAAHKVQSRHRSADRPQHDPRQAIAEALAHAARYRNAA